VDFAPLSRVGKERIDVRRKLAVVLEQEAAIASMNAIAP